MIKVRFFASLKEDLGTTQCNIDWQEGMTVAMLLDRLQTTSETWRDALSNPNLLVAVAQQHAAPDTLLSDHIEVAFFPPVTGG